MGRKFLRHAMSAMTKDDYAGARSNVRPHDHAVFVYQDETDLLMPLEHFLREGVQSRELTTFVHAYPTPDRAHAFLRSKIDDVHAREQGKDLVLAHHRDAFERAGRIDHAHVEGIVGMLSQSASGSGRKGVRIFVDASKQYLASGRSDEWFAFESWLGPRLHANCGLVCAYNAKHLQDPEVLSQVLRTHAYRFNAPGAPLF